MDQHEKKRGVVLLELFGKVAKVVAMVGELSSSSKVDFSLVSDELIRNDEVETTREASVGTDLESIDSFLHL